MSKPIVLVAASGFNDCWGMVDREVFGGRFENRFALDFRVNSEEAGRVVAIVVADQPVDDTLMEKFPGLVTIARTGTGYDNINIKAAHERKIVVTRVSHVNAASVSDFALGCIFTLSRNIAQTHQDMINWRWKRNSSGLLVSEMTVGIIGLGAIGISLAKKLRALGVNRLIGWNRTMRQRVLDAAEDNGLELLEIPQVMTESDVVVVAVALAPETRGLLSREKLALMKSHATLVNIARGPVVNETALAELVAEGKIGGVALDVFSVEAPAGDPFSQAFVQSLITSAARGRNVILTPHNAGLAKSSVKNISFQVARNILGVLDGDLEGVEVV